MINKLRFILKLKKYEDEVLCNVVQKIANIFFSKIFEDVFLKKDIKWITNYKELSFQNSNFKGTLFCFLVIMNHITIKGFKVFSLSITLYTKFLQSFILRLVLSRD